MSVLRKEFYGSSKYAVEIYTDSTSYHTDMKGKVLFYEGRHLDQEKTFTSFSALARIIRDYWAKHVGEVFDRRLASWFIEYGMESNFEEQSITDLLPLIKGEVTVSYQSHEQPVSRETLRSPQLHEQEETNNENDEITGDVETEIQQEVQANSTPHLTSSHVAMDVNSLEQAVLKEAEKLKQSQSNKASETSSPVKKKPVHAKDLDKEVIEKIKKQTSKPKKRKRAPRK